MWALLTTFALAAGLAVCCGLFLDRWTALAAWCALTGLACGLGAMLLARQPLGVSTMAGRIGGRAVRWGYRVSGGRLGIAVLVSWLIWTILGAAVIGMVQHRSSLQHVLMILAWCVDAVAMLYVIGILLARWRPAGQMPGSLVKLATILGAMIVGSLVLWWVVRSEGARSTALLIAGGPPLVIGVAYGLFVVLIVTVGRRARWN
jgi:hypothetical protein